VVFEYFGNDGRFQFVKKVANSHLGVKDRVNAVNAMIANARQERRLFVDPGCRTLIQDLEQVTWKADANNNITGELDKKDPKLTHSSDSLGYLIGYELASFIVRRADTSLSGATVGCAVTLKWATRRRSCANTRNTYSTWNRIVGTVKKSTETRFWT
jgi:hypothetical protein